MSWLSDGRAPDARARHVSSVVRRPSSSLQVRALGRRALLGALGEWRRGRGGGVGGFDLVRWPRRRRPTRRLPRSGGDAARSVRAALGPLSRSMVSRLAIASSAARALLNGQPGAGAPAAPGDIAAGNDPAALVALRAELGAQARRTSFTCRTYTSRTCECHVLCCAPSSARGRAARRSTSHRYTHRAYVYIWHATQQRPGEVMEPRVQCNVR